MLRLGFHYHIPAFANEKQQLMVPGYLGRFLDSLAENCEQLVCFLHSPRADEVPYIDYPISADNVTWVDIGPHSSVPFRMLNSGRYTAALKKWRSRLDAFLIRGPSPLLPAMASAAAPLPITLLLVGDYLAGIDDLPQPRWRKEAIRAWSHWNYWNQMRVARKALTFVNSRKLYEQLRPHVPNLIETRTTTLTQADFFYRTDTCQQKPIRLLYTGRMDRAKGLLDIVEAVALLVKQHEDVVLDLVGWPQKGDRIVEEIAALARARGIEERVIYHGFKPVGDELFAYYKKADIYVIASQSSFEGFPRTIWEAMAHSLPVVATSVGSIPQFLRTEGISTAELVTPGNYHALAEGISRVIHDGPQRQAMIQAGIKLAQENTLETRSRELVEGIEQRVRQVR